MKNNTKIRFVSIISLVFVLVSSYIPVNSSIKNITTLAHYDDESGKKNAILISTFDNDESFEKYGRLDEITDIFNKNDEWKLEVKKGKEVDVNTFKKIGKYDLVIINTHGLGKGELLSGDKYKKWHLFHFNKSCNCFKYEDDIKSGKVKKVDGNYIITPKLFEDIEGEFKDNIIILNACYSAENEILTDILLNNGASYCWGNSNISNMGVGSGTVKMIVNMTINEKLSQENIFEILKTEVVDDNNSKESVGNATKYNNRGIINEFKLYKNTNIKDEIIEESNDKYIGDSKENIIKNAEEKIEEIINEDVIFSGENLREGYISDDTWNKLSEIGINNGYFFIPNIISMIKIVIYNEETKKIVFLNNYGAILLENNEFTDITELFFGSNRDNYVEEFKKYCLRRNYIEN